MYSEDDIASAVSAGILTEQTADALRQHVAQLRRSPSVDEEHFRLITGFNDIFVVIACLLLLSSVSWIGNVMAPWLGAALSAACAWLLAEFFIRRRRMALPAIVLLLAFVVSVFAVGLAALGKSMPDLVVASAGAAGAAWLHWLRFKVPITVAAGTAALVGCFVAVLLSVFPEARKLSTPIAFVAGVLVFALAMRWDVADPQRQTRKADVAFWLHLLAAPLLVHPVFAVLGVFGGQTAWPQALAVMALYVAIAVISLAIDRRALMVSALAYVLVAFSSLLNTYGVVSLGFAITALVIGSALLLLSAFWHPCRRFALRLFPTAMRDRLPPLR